MLFCAFEKERERERERELNLQHLVNVAGTKDLMNDGKFVRILGGEIGSKDAIFGTPSPKQFAGRAR